MIPVIFSIIGGRDTGDQSYRGKPVYFRIVYFIGMARGFNHIASVYWVFTQLCNDTCDHCYNLSGPRGQRISEEDCLNIVDNLPDKIDRLILSGGEPLADRKLLHTILVRLRSKYGNSTQLMLQTNGDLLNADILKELIDLGVTRFDIASIDRYHKASGGRLAELAEIFDACGVDGGEEHPHDRKDDGSFPLTWGYWGANEDMWLGGNWARGRALQKNLWKKDPEHNFCAIHSGAIGFLTGKPEEPQEISIQLWQIHPCCPGTKEPIGDARVEKVSEVLARVSDSPIFQSLNDGDPLGMGESIGISREHAKERTRELQNICLWCDEFFAKHYDMKDLSAKRCKSAHQESIRQG